MDCLQGNILVPGVDMPTKSEHMRWDQTGNILILRYTKNTLSGDESRLSGEPQRMDLSQHWI